MELDSLHQPHTPIPWTHYGREGQAGKCCAVQPMQVGERHGRHPGRPTLMAHQCRGVRKAHGLVDVTCSNDSRTSRQVVGQRNWEQVVPATVIIIELQDFNNCYYYYYHIIITVLLLLLLLFTDRSNCYCTYCTTNRNTNIMEDEDIFYALSTVYICTDICIPKYSYGELRRFLLLWRLTPKIFLTIKELYLVFFRVSDISELF